MTFTITNAPGITQGYLYIKAPNLKLEVYLQGSVLMTSSRPWTVSIGKQRPQRLDFGKVSSLLLLYDEMFQSTKKIKYPPTLCIDSISCCHFAKKNPKTRFCETKNVITLCTIIKCSGSYKCFSFDSAGWLFLSWCASDSTQASCRADAFVCRSEWPAGGNKQGHTHTHDCHNTCQDRPRNRNLLLVRRVLLWTQ